MPLGTDLSKLLRKEEPATPQEAETIRMELNRLQSQVSALSGLVDSKGNLDANIFSHKSGEFSLLPHKTASMHRSNDSSPQTISDSTPTVITYDAHSALSAAEKRLSWQHGIKSNTSTGEFLLEGISEQTIWSFNCAILWDAPLPDYYYIYLVEKDTAAGFCFRVINSATDFCIDNHSIMMIARKASTSWQMVVLPSTAGAPDRVVGSATFQVARIR